MRRLNVFNSVSLDGYFTDANNDYKWAHEGANDPERMEFTKSNAQGTNALIFGRITYQLMVAYAGGDESYARNRKGNEGDRPPFG